MLLFALTFAAVAAHGARAATNATAVNATVPFFAPDSSQPLSQTLLSFSIEQDRWPDWSGSDSRNKFTFNALSTFARLTGRPPKIRVGANTEDKTVFDPTVTISEAEFPPPNTVTPYPEAAHVAVGNEYYRLSRFLPRGTHMTWGVNLGLDNATNAANMARAILDAFSSSAVRSSGVVLDLIEIGNEPDLYKNNELRPSNWTAQEYVADWINISTPVAEAIESHPLTTVSRRRSTDSSQSWVQGPVKIQGASFAGQGFTPRQIFDLGILESVPGELITVISQHRYSAAFCNGGDFPLISFMSKANVRSNLTVFNTDNQATVNKGLGYILGETGSIACHGAPGVSNTAGAALWVIDYTLQAATLGIGEVYFHEGVGFKYNFIQPITLNRSTIDGSPLNPPSPPHIQPSYYGGLVIASFIGSTALPFPFLVKNHDSARIVEIPVGDDNISGYAAFERGELVRAVFINLDAWVRSMEESGATRPTAHINLDFVADKAAPAGSTSALWQKKIQLRRLTIDHADDLSNLTWAGQSYELTSDVRPSGQERVETVSLGDGFDIAATEAVLVNFGV